MSDGPDIRPEDAMHLAQQNRAKLLELEETVDRLRDRIIELEAAIPDRTDYHKLDRDTKVGMVRQELVSRAQQRDGKAALDYDDIMWSVFDGEPSADHCYTLMERAAEAAGYGMRDPSNSNREITVDLDATNGKTGFSHANKESERRSNL